MSDNIATSGIWDHHVDNHSEAPTILPARNAASCSSDWKLTSSQPMRARGRVDLSRLSRSQDVWAPLFQTKTPQKEPLHGKSLIGPNGSQQAPGGVYWSG